MIAVELMRKRKQLLSCYFPWPLYSNSSSPTVAEQQEQEQPLVVLVVTDLVVVVVDFVRWRKNAFRPTVPFAKAVMLHPAVPCGVSFWVAKTGTVSKYPLLLLSSLLMMMKKNPDSFDSPITMRVNTILVCALDRALPSSQSPTRLTAYFSSCCSCCYYCCC